jgi:hypothetical protein
MTRKKEIKKRKRAKRKKNKQKKASTLQRFVKKVTSTDDLPFTKFIVEPEGHEKMSEVILDFAEPLLDECENEASEKIAVAMAILIWNVSLLPEKDQDREILKMCSELARSDDAKQIAELMDYANHLIKRKNKNYAENRRYIVKYEISGYGKDRRLDVASTLSL